jgi:hypothetical protein
MTSIRVCSECSKPDTEVSLFSVILPPELPDKVLLCRTCLSVVIDNSKEKNKEKLKEANLK